MQVVRAQEQDQQETQLLATLAELPQLEAGLAQMAKPILGVRVLELLLLALVAEVVVHLQLLLQRQELVGRVLLEK